MTSADRSAAPPPRREAAVPADEQEATATVESAEAVGIPSLGGVAKGLFAALVRPGALTREAVSLARDGARILRGTAEPAPSPKDKRFADPAWSVNPVYRRVAQGYLSLGAAR